MGQAIVLKVAGVELRGELNDSATAALIAAALPLEGLAARWGDEFYFTIPVEAGPEPGAREVVEAGELGYWPVGRAFCLFWGPTPVSLSDEIRAASPVNPFGRVRGDLSSLSSLGSQARIRVEKA